MQTFVEEVAAALYKKYGDEVSSLTILMPSKRARLFFAEALSSLAPKPIWEPRYSSIDEEMCRLSGLRRADRVRLITELYRIYIKYHKEEFDSFYYWGEMLISDFDMIDKYRIEASQLFTNIFNLKELEADKSYLNEKQLDILNHFWSALANNQGEIVDNTPTRKAFLDIWRSLTAIYEEFKAELRRLKIGYSGMIYRDAIERLERGDVEIEAGDRYVFIGFNALSKCEQRLMEHLSTQGVAEFYWDKDDYFAAKDSIQEAGMFIRANDSGKLKGEEGISHDNMHKIASIEVISTASNVSQCQYVVDILKKIASQSKDNRLTKDTAIVLTDESLLMPLLYALPKEMKLYHESDKNGTTKESAAINVTMGYPLRSTLAYSFVERLLELQKHSHRSSDGVVSFYHADVEGILSHPYLADSDAKLYTSLRKQIVEQKLYKVPTEILHATPLLKLIFCKQEGWRELYSYILEAVDSISSLNIDGDEGAFRAEFLSFVYDSVVRLTNIVDSCVEEIPLNDNIARSLLRRHLQSERIPFTGEPLEGLQIMGILETRNIDFRNIIFLSMTDSNFPGNHTADHSFIPYSLRYGFELPTAEHHEGVYAYYFYRLLSRAENIYMLYSSQADEKSSGEPSRYIRQLEYETEFPIHYKSIGSTVKFTPQPEGVVAKAGRVMDQLEEIITERGLSPTAFSTYVKCPMSFYYKYIEHIRIENDLEESVDSATFGNIFHAAAEFIYKDIKGQSPIDVILKSKLNEVEGVVDRAISQICFNRTDGTLPELRGEMQIIRNIICNYLRENVMRYDIEHSNFVVAETEHTIGCKVDFEVDGRSYTAKFEGKSDRIDSLNSGEIRVVDYKTGKHDISFTNVDSLFHDKEISKRKRQIINTLLYAMMLSQNTGREIVPELYYVGTMFREKNAPQIRMNNQILTNYSMCREEFETEVKSCLSELFNPNIPFCRCQDDRACTYCEYITLCRGKDVKK